ncbi:MAG: L-aspartate oxidase [Eubacteriales bacterium]|nr:L-aspartate oxidase [Eubacteriales bacterium]
MKNNFIENVSLNINTDIVIAGCGVAGLFAALNLPRDKKIIIITKSDIKSSDSFLAQGGMCVLKNDDDYDSYFEDTMRAGHYENNKDSVDIMIRSSRSIANALIHYGVDFERDANGELVYTREGAHSTPRILFHEDITGKEITSKLLAQVNKLPNVSIIEDITMLDIIEADNTCCGIICRSNKEKHNLLTIMADFTIWACGGIGGLYEHSTNFRHLTGDALAISLRHNIKLQNIDYIQIHPTTLYSKKSGRRFLISESVRGEGALLYNNSGERFIDELLPRDVVANAIYKQMEEDNKPYVWLSMAPLDKSDIISHFPNIYKHCLLEGYDVTKEAIPVVPAQHYFMGGVDVGRYSQTSMKHLYAVGETSCNGVHGANRLASNSLLESLVFAERAACDIIRKYNDKISDSTIQKALKSIDSGIFKNYDKLQSDNKKLIFDEIERMKKTHEQHINEAKCR